jgi:hypothetical protein
MKKIPICRKLGFITCSYYHDGRCTDARDCPQKHKPEPDVWSIRNRGTIKIKQVDCYHG